MRCVFIYSLSQSRLRVCTKLTIMQKIHDRHFVGLFKSLDTTSHFPAPPQTARLRGVKPIVKCRVCGNTELVEILDLGEQYLTGSFPRTNAGEGLTIGPLTLVKCHGGNESCGLVQLLHSYDASEMYGADYGYRSGLNYRMVQHLERKVKEIQETVSLDNGDIVIEIGSNDGTTLGFYPENLTLIGIDPTAGKFTNYYKKNIRVIADFFSENLIRSEIGNKKAKVISSFAMFYDLEDPVSFAQQIRNLLSNDGIWVFEQSFLPAMIEANAYDTVCHEHIEYYGLKQIVWILEKSGMRLIDVHINDTNGGSFSVIATPQISNLKTNIANISQVKHVEEMTDINSLETYTKFAQRVKRSKDEIIRTLESFKHQDKRVSALGASTKGNVVLQYCGITTELIDQVGDVNPDKYGCFTPGSWIPIKSEPEVLDSFPDALIVLPWHFRQFFVDRPNFSGRKLIFPLPNLEIVQL